MLVQQRCCRSFTSYIFMSSSFFRLKIESCDQTNPEYRELFSVLSKRNLMAVYMQQILVNNKSLLLISAQWETCVSHLFYPSLSLPTCRVLQIQTQCFYPASHFTSIMCRVKVKLLMFPWNQHTEIVTYKQLNHLLEFLPKRVEQLLPFGLLRRSWSQQK